jgi:hypothetical protein
MIIYIKKHIKSKNRTKKKLTQTICTRHSHKHSNINNYCTGRTPSYADSGVSPSSERLDRGHPRSVNGARPDTVPFSSGAAARGCTRSKLDGEVRLVVVPQRLLLLQIGLRGYVPWSVSCIRCQRSLEDQGTQLIQVLHVARYSRPLLDYRETSTWSAKQLLLCAL